MEYLVISITALFAAALALFSGFGLGTLLTPAFVFFFPVQVAIAATAIVHLVNNFFRIFLVGRFADWKVVLRFGLPAVLAAVLGAWLLGRLTWMPAMAVYQLGGRLHEITPVKLVIGVVIILFALLDLIPRLRKLNFNPKYLPVGGLFSGFFGGLSGNQGALRSAFLIKTGVNPKSFIGTNSICVVGVDIIRLVVYGASFYATNFALIDREIWIVVVTAVVSAGIGSLIGFRLIKRVTIDTVRYIVGAMLMIVGAGLTGGLL
ncbi:MAG TPA: sulfite exporter TauE/SafE family protein [Dehalococcoidales bacterium]|nr:sulfite exporter TauE/SafE family protein [Dehalococcoidales bacterium]